ncbi:MAG: ATP-dependent 6-phosphofructokinase [Desulfobacterales bacterium]|nr:ATP-dependent 6-phosphofructokinase [Desulfobacterales bacterium]
MNHDRIDTAIPVLGDAKIPSPIQRERQGEIPSCFISDSESVLIDVDLNRLKSQLEQNQTPSAFERAGPRQKIYFDPSKLKCAIVTCGGLCPGLNDIIRAIVLELYHGYGVHNIFGIRHGLQGFIPAYGHDIMELNPEAVVSIHEMGGTVLGSSRGPQPVEDIVDCIERMNIRLLFMIGGDGTLMAATRIGNTIDERNLKIGVIGIPKTIDNDIYLVSRSFGFDTAVDQATQAIISAHNEAKGYPNGISLIKLMGRYSGFIAATATLAQQDVNFTLIPEVDFDLEGPGGFLEALSERMDRRKHAVIVVAEGAGQKFFKAPAREKEVDISGNIKLDDIGLFLKDVITAYFAANHLEVSIKLIDPSYMIRSLPANANDQVFCSFLGRDAVHAGMAGKTKMIIGHWNGSFVHVPMTASAGKRNRVDPYGKLWLSVLEATGQGALKNPTYE